MKLIRAALVAAFILAIGMAGGTSVTATQGDDHKVGICHRTASDTNPYVFIEVDVASLSPGHLDNADPGHKPTFWKSDGVFRGASHLDGDPKDDYLATDASECEDTPSTTPEPTFTSTPTVEPSVTPTSTPTSQPTAEPSAVLPTSSPGSSASPSAPTSTPTATSPALLPTLPPTDTQGDVPENLTGPAGRSLFGLIIGCIGLALLIEGALTQAERRQRR